VAAIVLILIPKATLVGAFLGAAIMLGAIASHFVRPVGLEGDAGAMFPLAIVTFIAGSRPRSSGGSGG
jgi:hypothetical protein